jgi:release factor glutamine methyltransferase
MTVAMSASSATDVWTISRVLAWAQADLKTRQVATARLDAELMLAQVLGCDRVRLIVDGERPLGDAELAAYRELHKRRRRGEPVAYLRGFREFYGRPFEVDARVLVPRPETELLVEVALRRSQRLHLCARILDLCTGSGCVAITLKKERPTTSLVASDISRAALAVARRNAERLGALVTWIESDVYHELGRWRGRLDVVVANPPYIADAELAELPLDVRDFEPHLALVGGADGLDVTRRIIAQAPAMLAPGGVVCVEVVAGKARQVAELMTAAGLVDIAIDRDYAGHERIVSASFTTAT